MSTKGYQTRDSIEDIWGPRTPYKHEWPTRVDEIYNEKPDNWVQSACVLCSNGCGMDIGVKNGRVVGVRGRATDRVNKGRLGPKGMNSWVSNAHKDRLTHPLIRRNGRLERASWDAAMSLIVEKTKDVQQRLTSHGIGFYTSGQLFLEEYYALALVGKGGLQTLHMDGNTRLCTATAAASMRESFGSDGQPGSYTDIDSTDCLLVVGHNIAATQSVLWARILDRLAGDDPPSLIVVDPRRSDTAARATVHLAPKIGTNMAVLNGIQHLLFQNGWTNEQYLSDHVIGVAALQEKVQEYTPSYVESITGIPAKSLEEAAMIIGTADSLLSTALQGVYQSNQATASACQVNNINLLRGLIGKPGSGIYQMNGQPTAQNNRETGCDGEFPGFRNNENPNHMQELADIWNLAYAHVPHWNQPTHIQNMLSFIEKGSLELFWISGTNPLVSLPNLPRVRELLTKPELFVICQDIFMTETASIADVVLPAAQWAEKTGCYTNVDRTVHLSYKAIDPPGEARSDLDIFLDFARRMEFKDKDGCPLLPWSEPEEVFEAWKKLSKGRPCDYSALTYRKLTGGSGIQWPCNDEHPTGKERLFDDGIFFTDIEYCESYGHDLETGSPISKDQYAVMAPAGRAILKAAHYIPAFETPNEEFPLQLSTGRHVYHFHTRTKTGRSKVLQKADPTPRIEISAEDAAETNISDGERVVIRSRRGVVEMLVSISKIAKGQTFIPFHFGYFDAPDDSARAANELTIEQWDPVSKQPTFKSGAVRIEKCKNSNGEVAIHAKEKQSQAIRNAKVSKPDACDITDSSTRVRHLDAWCRRTYESISLLLDVYEDIVPNLIHDLEIQAGVRTLHRIFKHVEVILQPQLKKYSEFVGDKVTENTPKAICDAAFPRHHGGNSAFDALVTLEGLHMYVSYIESQLVALQSASQALWDKEFTQAINFTQETIARQQAWIKEQIKVKSPQTLVVPNRT